jgi:protease-4
MPSTRKTTGGPASSGWRDEQQRVRVPFCRCRTDYTLAIQSMGGLRMRRFIYGLVTVAVLGTVALPVHAQTGKALVPVFALRGTVTEAPMGEDFPFAVSGTESLKDLVTRLKKSATDANVKAVVLMFEGADVGLAQREELRQAMAEIRKSGKDIYTHADSLTTGSLLLLAGASHLSVVPTGDVFITGLYGEGLYLRGLLDKIGVQPDYITCGAYKSAAEMFMRTGPSPEADQMQNWLLDSVYDTLVKLIANGRRTTPDKVRGWIDGAPYTAGKAQTLGIIDAVEYRQEFIARMKSKFGESVQFNKKYGKKKGPEIDMSSPFGLLKFWAELLQGPSARKSTKNAVGIVYVDGPIVPGSGEDSLFGSSGIAYSTPIRKALDQAAGDNTIKAVVLRVDSPGGSAVASEIILDATKRVKAKKPLVVSMGNVAGSGGYYVACGADTIFADASTITGSIGVVSGKFATTQMWNKLGITFKSYRRGANAGFLSSERTFSDSERARLQDFMDEIYETFKGHVTAIRGKRLKKPIDDLAGGRVYTGAQALDLGLVDKIGTLSDAIAFAAESAKITDYDVRVVPDPKNFIELLVSELTGEEKDDVTPITMRLFGLGDRSKLLDLAVPQLRMLDPARARLLRSALVQLEILQQERVGLVTPAMFFGN